MLIDKFVKNIENHQDATIENLKNSNKEIIIYGASVYAYVVYKYLKAKGVVISKMAVDSAYQKLDTYMGVEVITIESILKDIINYHVVIGISNYIQVIEKFKQKGINSLITIDVPDFLNIPEPFMDFNFVEKNIDKFEEAYRLFEDDLSKRTFIDAINTKLTGDLSYILPNVEVDHLYFTKENFPKKKKEVMLDVGGYNGDSIRDFQNITEGNYEHIISLEPFPKLFYELNETVDKLEIREKCTTVQVGAWNIKDTLSFINTEMDIDSKIKTDGDLTIEVNTIDEILSDISYPVSYMKYDINGSEYNALQGAAKTIKINRPFIAVKIHVKEDFYRIPILLKKISPDIKLHLRQRNYMSMMLVLYGFYK